MTMSTTIDSALEALYEDDGLTDNLTDGPAKALLAWAESQIKAGTDPQQVRKAVRAANREDLDESAAAVAAASAALGVAAPGPSQPAPAATPSSPPAAAEPAAAAAPAPSSAPVAAE